MQNRKIVTNGETRIDVKGLDGFSVYLDGTFGGGQIEMFAVAGSVRCRIPGTGPYTAADLDVFAKSVELIPVEHRMDALIVRLSGAVEPLIAVEVR